MEVTEKMPFKERLSGLFFKEKAYFLARREIKWKSIQKCAIAAVAVGVIVVLFLPNPEQPQGSFHERAEAGSISRSRSIEGDPTQEAIAQMQGGGSGRYVPGSLDHLYVNNSGSGPSSAAPDRSSSMVLTRGGGDTKTQIPPGSRLAVRLYEKAVVASQGMPIIGMVTRDYVHEDAVAVPQGSKLFGEISFDDGGDRARIDWRVIQLPDRRERPISALGIGADGQVGVAGKVHSEALKNTIGQTLTRFIGAYAEGSMQRGPMGSNQGGSDNGLRNAVAETAKDRAEAWADDLKKENRWIEVSNGTEFYAVLTQSFAFRDPGATYGR